MDDIDQSLSISTISEWFKNLSWVGVGIGALGVIMIVYYLIKKDKK
jgi:hypothetical protein